MPYRTACWNLGLDVILVIFGLSLVSRKNRLGEAPLTICTPDMPCAWVGERSTAIWDSPLSTSSFCTLAWTFRIAYAVFCLKKKKLQRWLAASAVSQFVPVHASLSAALTAGDVPAGPRGCCR